MINLYETTRDVNGLADKYYLNYSALMREGKDGKAVQYYMFLHRPKPGAPLEVIR